MTFALRLHFHLDKQLLHEAFPACRLARAGKQRIWPTDLLGAPRISARPQSSQNAATRTYAEINMYTYV